MIDGQRKTLVEWESNICDSCTRNSFCYTFTALARTLEMSKGSNVTGTGCLMKQIFFVLASWHVRENDFGLHSNTLAIVDND